MRAYSEDLRKKIVAAIERGMPKARAARLFEVSLSSVKRYSRTARLRRVARARKESRAAPQGRRESQGPPRKRLGGATGRHRLTKAPLLGAYDGHDPKRLHRKTADEEDGLLPKRMVGAMERDEFLRAAWKVMVAERVGAERLVFVDEMGTNTSLAPSYAWAKKGQEGPTARCRATVGRTPPCFRA
jgi:hypothetical protein